MRVAYVGNFGPRHSTENHIARALTNLGHHCERLQENQPQVWDELLTPAALEARSIDVVLWTTTYGLAEEVGVEVQRRVMRAVPDEIVTVGYHLDRWWGLNREDQIHTGRPFFFDVDVLCTADGDHDHEWEALDIRHWWFPPAVSANECEPAPPVSTFASDVVFVGNWQRRPDGTPEYHPEWEHRMELVDWLMNSRFDVAFWPRRGAPGLRGGKLRQLYASAKVAVGDSCLMPTTDGRAPERYWSDRVPETLGRGCNLLHPWVAGFDEQFPYTEPNPLHTWTLGDWNMLSQALDIILDPTHDDLRVEAAEAGRQMVLEHHTYERRMEDLLDRLNTDL